MKPRKRAQTLKAAVIEPVGGHGGMNYYDFGLCRGLSRAGVEPVLYTCDETRVPRGTAFPVRLYFKRIYGPEARYKRAARYVRGLLRSLREARGSGASIAHFHIFHTTALEWISVRAARLAGLKTVITVHDVESFSGDTSKGLSRRIYDMADLIIVHNEVSLRAVSGIAEGVSSKTAVIPHGNYIDYVKGGITKRQAREKIGLDGHGPVILFFGQIKEVKGLDILLSAMPEAVKAAPDVRLVIAGKVWKDDFSRYDALIERHGLGRNVVRHIRYIPDDMTDYYYNAADVVALPYRKIYQSGVLLMAMSYGRPVVVSDLPGMTEAVEDGKTGFVFKNGDVSSLSGKIKQALADHAATEKVALAGLRKVKKDYDWLKIGAKTATAYRGLVQNGGG